MAYAVGVIVAATASTSEADREYRHHAYIIAQLQQQFQKQHTIPRYCDEYR